MVMRGDEYLSMLCGEQAFPGPEAKEEMTAKLMALWRLAFGDGPEYTRAFFETLYRPEDTLVWTEGCEIVSMLFLLPVFLQTQAGECVHGRYVYAVATHPDRRGRGYCGALLAAADRLIGERGECFAVLHPASGSLYGFYKRFGYETAFSCAEVTLSGMSGDSGADLSFLSSEAFVQKYMAFARKRTGELLWDWTALPFVYREAISQKGGAFAVHDAACGLYYQPEENLVIIKDLACADTDLEQVFEACRSFWREKEIQVRISVKKAEKWKKVSVSQPFGMIKYNREPFDDGALRHCPGFMGAVLD